MSTTHTEFSSISIPPSFFMMPSAASDAERKYEADSKYEADNKDEIETKKLAENLKDLDPLTDQNFPRSPQIEINHTQKELIATIMGNSPGKKPENLESSLTTAVAFAWEHPGSAIAPIVEDSIEKTAVFGTVFTVCGAVGGSKGALIGAAVGSAVGLICTAAALPEHIATIRNSTEYRVWKIQREQWLRDDIIQRYLTSDGILKYLVCQISKTIPEMPVCVSFQSDVTFEYDKIVDWLILNPTKLFPGVIKLFTVEDLKFDIPYVNAVRERLQHLFKEALSKDPYFVINANLEDHFPTPLKNIIYSFLVEGVDFANPFAAECVKRDQKLFHSTQLLLRDTVIDIWRRTERLEISQQDCWRELKKLERQAFSKKEVIFHDEGTDVLSWTLRTWNAMWGLPRPHTIKKVCLE